MTREEAIKVLVSVAICTRPILSCDNCPVWMDSGGSCKFPPDKMIEQAIATLQKHDYWQWFDEETGTPVTGYEREWGWRCTCCKKELPDDYDDPDCPPTWRYCPYCGARMRERSKR